MSNVKLTNRQAEALIKLRDQGPRSAYPGLHMGALNALSLKGLVSVEYRPGSMAMPHTSIIWTITPSGIEALRSNGGDHE